MAKNIALTLTIGGVKQNITNIKELEAAIKSAEEELKGLNIGSEGFKRLSTDVKNAKSVLEDFGESVKGQDLEKRVGAFAKVGEGITASFAGAQAAIALFGTDSNPDWVHVSYSSKNRKQVLKAIKGKKGTIYQNV